MDKHPDRLSGGQQQRAALVRALCTEPELLLLDEITAALDPELVGDVLTIVRDLAEAGTTMVLATHEMSFARDVATTVCFLDGGRILEQGPPSTMLVAPEQERTRQFLRRVLPRPADRSTYPRGVRPRLALLLGALVVPALPLLAAAPAQAAIGTICVGPVPAGTVCNDSRGTIPLAIAARRAATPSGSGPARTTTGRTRSAAGSPSRVPVPPAPAQR